MLTATVVVGCKRPETGASAPPIESTRFDAAAAARPTIEIREGKSIDLGIRLGLRDFAEAGDGGFVVLDQTGSTDLVVRRVASDLRTAWEVTIVGERRRLRGVNESAVVVAGSSAWVAITFDGEISYAGQRAVPVAVDKYDWNPDLLFLRLDLASGKVLAQKQYGQYAMVQRVRLGTDGTSVYAALQYEDPVDGKPGWGLLGAPPRRGYRFIRLEADGSTRWIVDATVENSAGPDEIRASSCCVLFRGQSSTSFDIGGVRVSPDKARIPASAWAVVLGAQDGRVLDARFLNVVRPAGDSPEGIYGPAALDGDAFHYALEGTWFHGTTGVLAFWQPALKTHRRMPLECGYRGCSPIALELIGEHVLAVLSGAGKIEARLYTKAGDLVGETHFVPESEGKLVHLERRNDGVVLYLATWDQTAPVPLEVRVSASPVY
jgi:hypothetical protein